MVKWALQCKLLIDVVAEAVRSAIVAAQSSSGHSNEEHRLLVFKLDNLLTTSIFSCTSSVVLLETLYWPNAEKRRIMKQSKSACSFRVCHMFINVTSSSLFSDSKFLPVVPSVSETSIFC